MDDWTTKWLEYIRKDPSVALWHVLANRSSHDASQDLPFGIAVVAATAVFAETADIAILRRFGPEAEEILVEAVRLGSESWQLFDDAQLFDDETNASTARALERFGAVRDDVGSVQQLGAGPVGPTDDPPRTPAEAADQFRRRGGEISVVPPGARNRGLINEINVAFGMPDDDGEHVPPDNAIGRQYSNLWRAARDVIDNGAVGLVARVDGALAGLLTLGDGGQPRDGRTTITRIETTPSSVIRSHLGTVLTAPPWR
jgi:hypothetical protein